MPTGYLRVQDGLHCRSTDDRARYLDKLLTQQENTPARVAARYRGPNYRMDYDNTFVVEVSDVERFDEIKAIVVDNGFVVIEEYKE